MKFVNGRHLVSLFVVFDVALLVIVNGQSTTDDDFDKDESSRLVDIVAELRAELASTKDQLTAAVDRIAKLERQDEKSHESKFNNLSLHIQGERKN